MPAMRPSRVLKKLRAGEIAVCTKLNLMDSRAVDIAAMYDFDCFWLDMEHVPSTMCDIEHQIRAAKVNDIDTMVRVPRGPYSDIVIPLEADAAGIMVPHVMSLDDAKTVVRQSRFHPVGRRPVDGGNADGAYCMIPFLEYIEQANKERFVIVQIEDPEPLADLDAICDLEGIDIILFGPADFSHSIGHPAQFDHPELVKAKELVAKTANKYGKVAGTVGSPANMQSLIDMGYRFISCGADVYGLGLYYNQLSEDIKKIVGK
ncbi:MAG: hypothetical protein JW936_09105 [Sedimentisphaerales bacterium]|nr:hypothetical protein [Sedimentisphaerales bacterium]